MIRLNVLQYNPIKIDLFEEDYSLDSLISNDNFEKLCKKYKESFGYSKLKTFSFSKEGFLGLFLELKGKIAISLGESQALIEAGMLYESLGFEIIWINLEKNGKVNIAELENKHIDFLFLSSYVMDTFVKTSIKDIKQITKAKIISNASANFDKNSDAVYFDNYKLVGFNISSVLLFNEDGLFSLLSVGQIDSFAVKLCLDALKNQKFNYQLKAIFLEKLKEGVVSPNMILKDPYVLDFLELNDRYLEKDLEDAILRDMENFILELGNGFSFIARQKRVQIGNDDFYIDLLFYNRKLKRLIALDLKLGKFKAEYKGQMELYLKYLEKQEKE